MKVLVGIRSVCSVMLALGLSTAAFAADYEEVPAEQAASYKEAVRLASRKASLPCMDNQYYDSLQRAQNVKVENQGGQPLLIFDAVDGAKLTRIKVFSTQDYQSIKGVRVEDHVWTNTNQGTLREPKIVPGWLQVTSCVSGQFYN